MENFEKAEKLADAASALDEYKPRDSAECIALVEFLHDLAGEYAGERIGEIYDMSESVSLAGQCCAAGDTE